MHNVEKEDIKQPSSRPAPAMTASAEKEERKRAKYNPLLPEFIWTFKKEWKPYSSMSIPLT
jgi:hypothetical protein